MLPLNVCLCILFYVLPLCRFPSPVFFVSFVPLHVFAPGIGRRVRDAHSGADQPLARASVLQHQQEHEHQLGFPQNSSGMLASVSAGSDRLRRWIARRL